ncbi:MULTISPECIES: tripartite tricarboxylate transporter TctB family protein [unclassified Massilia]|uniref:tripartite tricarboxylate transporter TctB family protein n=1 Tax=unclassified Massilia TaxID=2609279 RepID=UPI0017803B86|nr:MULTISPECIES: tripartite tricarboxylate transporter TctB family protein [unclassified Massilia]MBD8529274.1 tripartite tricarboxylate transporter TctB family protein [Massilia sp. CFBP 13647]MBD8672668.1 tripartite tricarboxylate transporter TctB family protein [Massilia sp. CFBP 13721]
MSAASEHSVPAWRAPLCVGLALLVLGGLTLTDAYRVAESVGPGVGPSAAMKLIAGLLVLLGIAHLVGAGRAAKHTLVLDAGEKVNLRSLAWVLGGLVLQIVAIGIGAGFIISSTILFTATACGFGRSLRSWGPVYGLVLTTLVYLFFTKALSLSLPMGPLEQLLG